MNINVDNSQAESFCKNLNVNSKLRTTFNMKESWIQELRDKQLIKTQHIDTTINPADILTKSHNANRFTHLLALCNPIDIIR